MQAGVYWRAYVLLSVCFCCTHCSFLCILRTAGVGRTAACCCCCCTSSISYRDGRSRDLTDLTAGTLDTTSADSAALCCDALALPMLLFLTFPALPPPSRPLHPASDLACPLTKEMRMKLRPVVLCSQRLSVFWETLEGRTAHFGGVCVTIVSQLVQRLWHCGKPISPCCLWERVAWPSNGGRQCAS